MTLNKQKGNMYTWCSHTWNPIRGKCPHNCSYCYYQNNPRFKAKIGKLMLNEKCFKDNLGRNNFIFVGSSTDMFAKQVPSTWIIRVLEYCKRFDNNYLFQTKNPERFKEFINLFPKKTYLGTTLESNRNYGLSKAPPPYNRVTHFANIKGFKQMISIEPILDFDLATFSSWLLLTNPEFISIGADSKNHKLPEPTSYKLEMLIKELKPHIELKLKDNLKRINTKRKARQ